MQREHSREEDEASLEMAAEELGRLAADPNLISGIYNYCDRWCERCPQTRHCLNFKMQQARETRRGRPIPADTANAEFWDELGKSFALALYVLRQEAQKHGVDLDSPEVMSTAATEERAKLRQAAREGSALRRAASNYRKTGQALLERLPAELDALEKALNREVQLGVGAPRKVAAEVRDAMEVVSWYLYFIEVKLVRAVASRVDEQTEQQTSFARDSDGSAKVALIAIDRSMAAWAVLREYFETEQDGILGLLVQLERLRERAEYEFPRARKFHRAGLD